MSDERIEKAWRGYRPNLDAFDITRKRDFTAGFLAGLADALTMPEVRADELEEGKNFPQEGVAR